MTHKTELFSFEPGEIDPTQSPVKEAEQFLLFEEVSKAAQERRVSVLANESESTDERLTRVLAKARENSPSSKK